MASGCLYLPFIYSFSTKFKHFFCVQHSHSYASYPTARKTSLFPCAHADVTHKFKLFFCIQCSYFIHLKPYDARPPFITLSVLKYLIHTSFLAIAYSLFDTFLYTIRTPCTVLSLYKTFDSLLTLSLFGSHCTLHTQHSTVVYSVYDTWHDSSRRVQNHIIYFECLA
jgi:hypothetical protein